MKTFLLVCIFFTGLTAVAQQPNNTTINGIYHLFTPEKGPSGPTKKMIIELAEKNNTKMLAVAACKGCYPAIYTYKPTLSKQFKKPIYYNSSGIHVLTYDDNSFIICVLSTSTEKKINYINFYSKSKSKVDAMTTKKTKAYASKILAYL